MKYTLLLLTALIIGSCSFFKLEDKGDSNEFHTHNDEATSSSSTNLSSTN